MYFNNIALIGFLGSDAEARTTKNGASYTVLSLATKRSCRACHARRRRRMTAASHDELIDLLALRGDSFRGDH